MQERKIRIPKQLGYETHQFEKALIYLYRVLNGTVLSVTDSSVSHIRHERGLRSEDLKYLLYKGNICYLNRGSLRIRRKVSPRVFTFACVEEIYRACKDGLACIFIVCIVR